MEEGLAQGGRGGSGALYSVQDLTPHPTLSKEEWLHADTCTLGYSHVGGGGLRRRGCVLATLYSVHGLTPPPFIEGRMAACRHLQFGGIPIWLEEGLGIGGVS